MVTLNKNPRVEDFGMLMGDYRISTGQRGAPFVSASGTGSAIKTVIREFCLIEPNARILQYALMPDHLHLLLFVERQTQNTLAQIMAIFKVAVNRAAGIDGVFARGFNDQILKPSRSLDTLFRYLRENPWRLAVRKACPEFFRRVSSMRIGGADCQAYGNLQLLENPFREQVVHRTDSTATCRSNRDLWLHTASNGGVLVSPFISPVEKAIRAEAEEAGGRIILIIHEPMGERYKPAGRDFELCERGRLLIVSARRSGALTRETCLAMNSLAAAAAS